MSKRRKKTKPTTTRGKNISVYFLCEDEEMLDALGELSKSRVISSASSFIAHATRLHFAAKRKELGV